MLGFGKKKATTPYSNFEIVNWILSEQDKFFD